MENQASHAIPTSVPEVDHTKEKGCFASLFPIVYL